MLTKWPSLAKRSLAHTQYFISGAITTHFFKNIFVHLYGRVNGLPTRRSSVITSPGVRKRRDIADNILFRFESKSNLEEQRTNSQPTPTHAGGDRKFLAAAAFGAPIENFGGCSIPKKSGSGATGAAQGSSLNRTSVHL